MKRNILSTSSLCDAAGHALPSVLSHSLLDLPRIAAAALDLPAGIEARLTRGDIPTIILWHRTANLHIEMPLRDMDAVAGYVAALEGAARRQAMGEPPEAEGYRVQTAPPTADADPGR